MQVPFDAKSLHIGDKAVVLFESQYFKVSIRDAWHGPSTWYAMKSKANEWVTGDNIRPSNDAALAVGATAKIRTFNIDWREDVISDIYEIKEGQVEYGVTCVYGQSLENMSFSFESFSDPGKGAEDTNYTAGQKVDAFCSVTEDWFHATIIREDTEKARHYIVTWDVKGFENVSLPTSRLRCRVTNME